MLSLQGKLIITLTAVTNKLKISVLISQSTVRQEVLLRSCPTHGYSEIQALLFQKPSLLAM